MRNIFIRLSGGKGFGIGRKGLKYVGDLETATQPIALFAVAGQEPTKAYFDAFGLDMAEIALTEAERNDLVASDEASAICTDGTKFLRASGEEISPHWMLTGDGSNSERSAMIAIPEKFLVSPLEEAQTKRGYSLDD